jgi:Transcription factor e(y)2
LTAFSAKQHEVILGLICFEIRLNSQLPQNINVAQRKLFLEQKLRESGEEARIEEYLRQKLIECGWKDELKKHCKGLKF